METAVQGSAVNKYLGFKLAAETYGIEILKVREIIGLMDITAVPKAAGHIRGVINLRGKIVPVLDLRAKFGLPAQAASWENCIITVNARSTEGELLLGVLVDSVSEVLSVEEGAVEPLPALGEDLALDFVLGLAKVQGKVSVLLDIDKVIQAREVGELQRLNASLQEA